MDLWSCTPLVIFALLAIFSLATSLMSKSDNDNGSIVQQLLGYATVMLIIGVLCSHGYKMGAWAVLILLFVAPLIFLMVAGVLMVAAAK